jgi:hypothetical protein
MPEAIKEVKEEETKNDIKFFIIVGGIVVLLLAALLLVFMLVNMDDAGVAVKYAEDIFHASDIKRDAEGEGFTIDAKFSVAARDRDKNLYLIDQALKMSSDEGRTISVGTMYVVWVSEGRGALVNAIDYVEAESEFLTRSQALEEAMRYFE